MTGLHESTLALSVYTALVRHGSLTRDQACSVLSAAWDPRLERDEVDAGAEYLLARRLVVEADGVLTPSSFKNGAARTVIRSATDQTELVFT